MVLRMSLKLKITQIERRRGLDHLEVRAASKKVLIKKLILAIRQAHTITNSIHTY